MTSRSRGSPGTLWCPALAFSLALVPVTLVPVTLVLAQDAPGKSPPRATDLDDASLVSRGAVVALRLADAEKALDAEEKALAAGSEQLEAKRARIAAPALPADAPAPVAAGLPTSDAAKAAQDVAASRLDALTARVRLLEDERSLLDERSRRLERARAAEKEIVAALDEAEPVASELEVRIAARKLATDKLPAAIATRGLAERRVKLASIETGLRDDARQVAEALTALPALLAAARDDARAAAVKLAQATRAAHEISRREAFEKELADRDPATLLALLSTLEVDRERLAQALEPGSKALERARSDAFAFEAELRAETPPDAARPRADAGPARVVAAQRTLDLVTAVADYQKRRADRLARLEAALAKVGEQAAAVASAAAALDEQLLRIQVASELVARLVTKGTLSPGANDPTAPSPASLDEERRRLRATSDAAVAAADDARARVPRLSKEIAEAASIEKAQREKLEPLRSALETAKTNARWTQEVENLPTAEVVQRFHDAHERSRLAGIASGDASHQLALSLATVESATATLGELDGPLARRARRESAPERRRIRVALSRLAGREPPPESADSGLPPKADPPASSEAAASQARGSAALAAFAEERETTLVARGQALGTQLQALAALEEDLARASATAGALARALDEERSHAQRAYGAALELETRAGLGELPVDKLPSGVSEAGGHERLAALETDLVAAQSLAARLEDRRRRTEAVRTSDARSHELIAQAAQVAGKTAFLLRERALLEASYERPDVALSETEKKRRTQETMRRLETGDSRAETALGIFTNDRAELLTDLLHAYYGELVELERKRLNVEQRNKLTTDILLSVEEERRCDLARLPLVRRQLVRFRADEAEGRVRAGLVPTTDDGALADLQADGRPVPSPEPIASVDLGTLADRLFEMRARVIATEGLVRELEGRLSESGIGADKGARQDELGALSARLDALAREGRQTDEDVAQTRRLRRSVLERAAVGSLVRLLLIPLVAFGLIRFVDASGRRVVKRIRNDPTNTTPDREQRAQTIVHVFNRTSSGVLIMVAAIYMLKELKIDVTPIVASAGVVGLAIAFGAQALVRDYFAGFFILAENQYKIGDTVKIGDSSGIVEKITLRLTVLRADDGTVFYIPNGNVQLVANLTRGWAKTVLKVSVGYEADLDRVSAVLREVGKQLDADDEIGAKILEPPQVLGVEDFGEKGVTVSMLFRTLPNEQLAVEREARRRIKKAFDREKIPVPASEDVVHHVYPPEGPAPPASPPASQSVN